MRRLFMTDHEYFSLPGLEIQRLASETSADDDFLEHSVYYHYRKCTRQSVNLKMGMKKIRTKNHVNLFHRTDEIFLTQIQIYKCIVVLLKLRNTFARSRRDLIGMKRIWRRYIFGLSSK